MDLHVLYKIYFIRKTERAPNHQSFQFFFITCYWPSSIQSNQCLANSHLPLAEQYPISSVFGKLSPAIGRTVFNIINVWQTLTCHWPNSSQSNQCLTNSHLPLAEQQPIQFEKAENLLDSGHHRVLVPKIYYSCRIFRKKIS